MTTKWVWLAALLMGLGALAGCTQYQGWTRYDCQLYENWQKPECNHPQCEVQGICTDDILGEDISGTNTATSDTTK